MPREQVRRRKYRLPTEAEWEYACRAGTETPWFCPANELGDHAWYNSVAGGHIHPVGEKKPNPWGIYDLCGNVAEWCLDGAADNFYHQSPTDDPIGPPSGRDRTFRGGRWGTPPLQLRSAFRVRTHQAIPNLSIGFRVVCETQ